MEEKQQLIDICFQIGLMVKSNDTLKSMSDVKLAEWIAEQLKGCGFNTEPCGSSWGILK